MNYLHRIGTALWAMTFGIVYVFVVAWGEAKQEEINRQYGDGEA